MNCGPGTVMRPGGTRETLCCPVCGGETRRAALPLFVVAGVSGSGKTTMVEALRSRLSEVEIFDADVILHIAALGWETFGNTWLQLAGAIALNGRPTLLCGTLTPEQLVNLPGRGLIGPIHFCLLDPGHEVITTRLRARPAWRGSTEEFIAQQAGFAESLRTQITPVFDTATLTVADTADAIAGWARRLLSDTGVVTGR